MVIVCKKYLLTIKSIEFIDLFWNYTFLVYFCLVNKEKRQLKYHLLIMTFWLT